MTGQKETETENNTMQSDATRCIRHRKRGLGWVELCPPGGVLVEGLNIRHTSTLQL